MSAAAYLDAYRALADQTRARVLAFVTAALVDVSDEATDTFLSLVVPMVVGGQLRLGALTDAYLAQVAADVLGGRAEPTGVTSDRLDYPRLRNGMPPEVVYLRPVITARKALADGARLDQALDIGRARLDATVQTDLQNAERRAAFEVIQADDRITGFRRVIRPAASKTGTCGLCVAASAQRYTRDDLMPIHARCHCSVMPLFGRRDPALEINQQRYAEAARLAKEAPDGTARARLAAVRVREHGELGPVLTRRGDRFTGPGEAVAG